MQGLMSEGSERLCRWERKKNKRKGQQAQEGGVEYELKRQILGER